MQCPGRIIKPATTTITKLLSTTAVENKQPSPFGDCMVVDVIISRNKTELLGKYNNCGYFYP